MKSEAIQTLASASLFASIFLIPLMMRDKFGSGEAEIGLVVAAYYASLFFSSMAFGRLADVRGRRRILQAGLLVCIFASAVQYFADSSASLLAVRVLMGLAAGTFPSAIMAYAYESHGKAGRFAAYGALGWGIGTLLAGFVAVYSLMAPFLVSTALFAVAFVISLFLPFPRQKLLEVPVFPVNVIRRNAASYTAMLLRHTGANMIWVIYPIFLARINSDPVWIGVVYAVNAGTQFVVMQFLDRYDGRKLLASGLVVSALTFFLFTVSENEWMVIIDQLFLGCSWALMYVGALRCVLGKGEERSTSSGLLDSTISLSAIFGSLAGGFIAAAFNEMATMYAAIAMSLVGFVIFLAMSNGRSKASAQTQGRASG